MRERRVQVVDAASQLVAAPAALRPPEPLKKSWSALRVGASKRSKTSSSSTAVAVWSVPITPPSSIVVAVLRAELEVDVAVGDAGQRDPA